MMKTPREMVAKLQALANQINAKTRQIEKLHRNHKLASQGNMRFVNGRVNKNTYTNANYMRNIKNAMRIVYEERKPLMNKYNKTAKKYRELLGLPTARMPGYIRGPKYQWNWQKLNKVNFSRAKRTSNGPTPNVMNLYTKYQPLGATTGSGGGGYNSRVTLGASYNKFHPNNQLINTIRKGIAAEYIREALYRPPKMKGFAGGLGPKGGVLYGKLAKKWSTFL
jgi:hypothetical protein